MKRFYGFSLAELNALDVEQFESYWAAISVLEAQDALNTFKITALPNRPKNEQTAQLRELENAAYPRQIYPRKSTSLSELDKILNGG